jgi:hypothetical protein
MGVVQNALVWANERSRGGLRVDYPLTMASISEEQRSVLFIDNVYR